MRSSACGPSLHNWVDLKTFRNGLNIRPMKGYSAGVICVIIAALCGSSGGILVRLVEHADGWQLLFYRSVFFALTVFVFMLIGSGRHVLHRFLGVGFLGAVVAVCLGTAFIAYIFSLLLTTVANAVFILSAAPFFTALMAWAFLHERVSPLVWICMLAGLVGVAIMMAQGVFGGTMAGSAVALIAAFGYSASVVAYRAGKDIDMMPATCLAGVFAAAVSGLIVGDLELSGADLVIAILLGTVQIGLQYILITVAARCVPAAEVTLLMLLEVVAAPIWVWIALGETPAILTLVGGAIVLTAVVVQAKRATKKVG